MVIMIGEKMKLSELQCSCFSHDIVRDLGSVWLTASNVSPLRTRCCLL